MRRLVVALATALALTASGLVGCTMLDNPVADANEAISGANAHLKKFQTSSDTVQKLASDLEQLEVTKTGAVSALQVIAKLREQLDVQRSELALAAADLGRVGELDVDAKFKKYARLEIAVTTAELAVVEEGGTLYSQMERMYTAIRDGKATTKVTSEIMADVGKSSDKITELTDAAAKAKDAADSYFNIVNASK